MSYILKKNGKCDSQMKEMTRKMEIAMRNTWSIGEHIFQNGYVRRIKMYKSLVESVGLYGAEIWGWDREVELDRIQRKNIYTGC